MDNGLYQLIVDGQSVFISEQQLRAICPSPSIQQEPPPLLTTLTTECPSPTRTTECKISGDAPNALTFTVTSAASEAVGLLQNSTVSSASNENSQCVSAMSESAQTDVTTNGEEQSEKDKDEDNLISNYECVSRSDSDTDSESSECLPPTFVYWESNTQLVIDSADCRPPRTFVYKGKCVRYNDLHVILEKLCRQAGYLETVHAIIDMPQLEYAPLSPVVLGIMNQTETEVLCDSCKVISSDLDRCQTCRRKFTFKMRSKKQQGGKGRCRRKKKVEEPVCLSLISSDEEEGEIKVNGNGLPSGWTSTSVVSYREPIITEETTSPVPNKPPRAADVARMIGGGGESLSDYLDDKDLEKAYLHCRSVRIGSYKTVPVSKVLITEIGMRLQVPTVRTEVTATIHIAYSDIVKVLTHFGHACPSFFYYLTNEAGRRIRAELEMSKKPDPPNPYFDPTSKVEIYRRLVLLPSRVNDEVRLFLKSMYDDLCLIDELSSEEADRILKCCSEVEKTLAKETFQPIASFPPGGLTNIMTIMVYPPPPMKNGIPINTEDYSCLTPMRYLNDVIIDFYLKYLVANVLSPTDQKRTHVFSSFFYKRLTAPPTYGGADRYVDDPRLSPAERRHARVKGWTKSVDIFSKDFIIIPINEKAHWYLTIICFPGLFHPVTMKDGRPVNASTSLPLKKVSSASSILSRITIKTPLERPISIEGDEERDEAEADDDDIDPSSDEDMVKDENEELMDEATHPVVTPKAKKDPLEPIKQPCILIFDSFLGPNRSRVCATLREYLQVEWNNRHKGRPRDINKYTMRASVVKAPQQNNYVDCGLYVLQYAESFFENPITDFRLPIKQLQNWFSEDLVSRKRYQIQQLLLKLMKEQNVDIPSLNLPDLGLKPEGTASDHALLDMMDEDTISEGDMDGEEEEEFEGETSDEEFIEKPDVIQLKPSSSSAVSIASIPLIFRSGEVTITDSSGLKRKPALKDIRSPRDTPDFKKHRSE